MGRIRNQNGFLLIEVLIAMVIVSIAIVAAAGMFIQSTRANASAEQYSVAAVLAQKQMELLKRLPTGPSSSDNYWVKIPSLPANIHWQGEESHPVVLNNTKYSISTTVDRSDEDSVNMVQVQVKVSWSDKELVVTTLFSKLPTQ